jgi:hypothetical protein
LIGKEAAAAFGPGGFASRVILRLRGKHLASLQFVSEWIDCCRRTWSVDWQARCSFAEVQRRGDDGDGDEDETRGARDGGQIEETAAHQWNICALPG